MFNGAVAGEQIYHAAIEAANDNQRSSLRLSIRKDPSQKLALHLAIVRQSEPMAAGAAGAAEAAVEAAIDNQARFAQENHEEHDDEDVMPALEKVEEEEDD